MNEDQMHLIGVIVDGWFHSEDGDGNLIYGSNDFPCHRITVDKEKAEQFLDSYAQLLVENSQGE